MLTEICKADVVRRNGGGRVGDVFAVYACVTGRQGRIVDEMDGKDVMSELECRDNGGNGGYMGHRWRGTGSLYVCWGLSSLQRVKSSVMGLTGVAAGGPRQP